MSLLPELSLNASGWGPDPAVAPEDVFADIPYAPFSKGDVLGKAADWSVARAPARPQREGPSGAWMATTDEADNDGYSLVDNRTAPQTAQRNRGYTARTQQQRQYRGPRRAVGGTNWQSRKVLPQQKLPKNRRGPQRRWNDWRNQRKFNSSIEIDPGWGEPVLTLDFATMQGRRVALPSGETLVRCGLIERFNSNSTRLTARQEKPLERQWASERKFYQVTTCDDPVLSELRVKGAGTVYGTDTIVTTLMAAFKSTYSWDVIVRKKDGVIVFDKRDESNLDLVTVNENSHDPPGDDTELAANSADALSKEATLIALNLSQQVLDKESPPVSLERPNPFAQGDERLASVGYVYRKFLLGDETVVVRAEVDGYRTKDDKTELLLIKALNEYDLRITNSWRQMLETQRAGTFATEARNNGCKLAKWAAQAYLAEADGIEIGYVSRTSMRDPHSHVVLGVEERTMAEYYREMGADLPQLWGSLVHLLEQIRAQPDGTYLLVKDPDAKQLSVYDVGTEFDAL